MLSCRLKPDEHANFKTLAVAHGLSPAEYLSHLIRKKVYKTAFMRKNPVKITLTRNNDPSPIAKGPYVLKSLTNAIIVQAGNKDLRVGDVLTEQDAVLLNQSVHYEVTVTSK